ncbi:MAG: DUF1501 domain-containing protein [Rhodopirellula sp.]|nr:DUF1501 domain-containing protein [Rhodopirellula sp.]
MLNISGLAQRLCDGVSRRSFMQVGTLAVGGLTLTDVLRAEQASGSGTGHKAVIMVYLTGGISHQDTVDLKPDAPAEIRGEFNPIPTSVPGIEICELMPQMAKVADRCAIIRSVVGQRDEHSSFQSLTGYQMGIVEREGFPNFGSVVSQVLGSTNPVTPPFIDLFPTMKHRPYNSTGAGYLGIRFNQVKADGEDLASMKLRFVSSDQFGSRRTLLRQLDSIRRSAEDARLLGMDENYDRAFDVLTSSRLVEALDLSSESEALRDRYGKGSPKHLGDGAPLWNEQLLQARRLVEAGVRVVTVAYGFWDTHGNNFAHMKQHLPTFDQGVSALIEDIYQRGLGDDVTVVVCDEFGRTPKINSNAGRDHWAPVNCAWLAGGGMKVGQVIGSTDKTGAYAADRPVDFRDILATIYHNLGIDQSEMIRDQTERPVLILPSDVRPIRELIA